jgi:hypothetical protein
VHCKITLLEEANLPQKESFRRMMKFFMICALWCFDKSASELDSLFMPNEKHGGAKKFSDIIQMREMNSCKNISDQV